MNTATIARAWKRRRDRRISRRSAAKQKKYKNQLEERATQTSGRSHPGHVQESLWHRDVASSISQMTGARTGARLSTTPVRPSRETTAEGATQNVRRGHHEDTHHQRF